MAYEIQTNDGDFVLVDANSGRPLGEFLAFFKRGEQVIEKRDVRRGIWPFRWTETVERDVTPEYWVVSIRTETIAAMKPISDEDFAAKSKPTT